MSRRLIGAGGMNVQQAVAPAAAISNAAVAGDVVSIRDWDHITILINFGSFTADLNADLTITGSSAVDGTSDDETLATINFRKDDGSGTWGAITQVTDSKLDIVASGDIPLTENTQVAIEIDAAEIKALSTSADLDYVHFDIGAGGAYAYYVSAVYILSRGRYTQDIPLSVRA